MMCFRQCKGFYPEKLITYLKRYDIATTKSTNL